MLTKTNICSV